MGLRVVVGELGRYFVDSLSQTRASAAEAGVEVEVEAVVQGAMPVVQTVNVQTEE
jgi:predicted translin family RNA/ssDNA-binding protein